MKKLWSFSPFHKSSLFFRLLILFIESAGVNIILPIQEQSKWMKKVCIAQSTTLYPMRVYIIYICSRVCIQTSTQKLPLKMNKKKRQTESRKNRRIHLLHTIREGRNFKWITFHWTELLWETKFSDRVEPYRRYSNNNNNHFEIHFHSLFKYLKQWFLFNFHKQWSIKLKWAIVVVVVHVSLIFFFFFIVVLSSENETQCKIYWELMST